MQRKKVRTASNASHHDAVLLACTPASRCGRPAMQKQNFAVAVSTCLVLAEEHPNGPLTGHGVTDGALRYEAAETVRKMMHSSGSKHWMDASSLHDDWTSP